MGRPRKEGMDYFPHDVDAVADEKIEAIRTMFGNDGYAFYFISLERIYRSDYGELDVSNRLFVLTLANKVMVSEERMLEMIHASTEFGLFDKAEYNQRKVLTSKGIKKRFIQINGMRDKWRIKKNDNDDSFLDGKPQFSPEKTTVFPREKCIKESKGKESKEKEKESKEKESSEETEKHQYAERVTLTPTEHTLLVNRFGLETTNRCIEELSNYKLMTGKAYDSDCGAIMSWVYKRVEEQDARQAPMARYQPNSKPSSRSQGNKNVKHGMEIHVQEDDSVSDEEFQQILAEALKLDEQRAKREADRKRMEDNPTDE